MKAKITKISERKMSRNGDVKYIRVNFQLEDGRFAMTDLVSTYRNFAWWKEAIQKGVGTWVNDVWLKDGYADKVNADSPVYVIKAPLIPEQQELL